MPRKIQTRDSLTVYFLILILITVFALWFKSLEIESNRQQAGITILSLGIVLLAAYVFSRILKITKLPLITGYIFAGIIAGPYITGFLSVDDVERFRLVDDLALSFIAFTAGGALHLQSLKKKSRIILFNVALLTIVVFAIVYLFIISTGRYFDFINTLSSTNITVFAILLGVVSVARSPSSAIAIISECRASGPFTETILGVTVVMDILVIIFFTFAMTIGKIVINGSEAVYYTALTGLSLEILASILIGIVLGKGISIYIDKAGHDLPLFLLFLAFGVTRTSLWISDFTETHFNIFLHLEPLLICMSTGFTVQNFGSGGKIFMESLDRMALPIYVLFFSLAGASLNIESLIICWPLALSLVFVRAGSIFLATWTAGTISRDPSIHKNNAWMAYLTQAGVAIGLAQLAQRQFPEIGSYLTTVVLAVISINQVVGPITFKAALNIVKETGRD